MIQEVVNSQFLSDRLDEVISTLEDRANRLATAPKDVQDQADGITAEMLREAAQHIRTSKKLDELRDQDKPVWIPRDPRLGAVQSALEELYINAGAVEEPQAEGAAAGIPPTTARALKADWVPTAARSFMRQMEESDYLGWGLSFAVARTMRLFSGKAKFRDNASSVRIDNKVRLVLCADWASGLPRAERVAGFMKERLFDREGRQRDRHLIHLGDVYYAGRDFEYKSHMSDLWPVNGNDPIGSYCLNANHDMFSGGHGLYRFLDQDARFSRQCGCTFFCLENDNWQIFGLDTAHESEGFSGNLGGLRAPQTDWIMANRARAPHKKTMFLSHHQLFSSYEKDSPLLAQRLSPLLTGPQPLNAWFWGHEHRCAVYAPKQNILYPALIGHGGVPVYSESRPKPSDVRFQFEESFRVGLEKFARLGFAVVDLDEDKASVVYVNELGKESREAPHSIP